jgi:hypothetical protein
MRNSTLLLAALGPLAITVGIAMPLAARSAEQPLVADPAGEAINLDAIPVKPVTGPLSIKGVPGDDDENSDRVGGEASQHDDDGFRGADREDDD